jgi:ABC-type transport system substrate-binding protein
VQLLLEHLDPPPAERATWLGLLLTIIIDAEERDIANYANRNYYRHYNSSRVPDLLKQADAETDEAKRRELYRKVQQQLADDAANLWVYAPNQLQVLRRGLENVQVQGIAPSLYLGNASSS